MDDYKPRPVRAAAGAAVAVTASVAYVLVATPESDQFLYHVGTLAAALAALSAWGFCLLYSRGPWRKREAGRHLMWSTTVKGTIFTYLTVLSLITPVLREGPWMMIRLWVYGSCAVILMWRFRMLWTDVTKRDMAARLKDAADPAL